MCIFLITTRSLFQVHHFMTSSRDSSKKKKKKFHERNSERKRAEMFFFSVSEQADFPLLAFHCQYHCRTIDFKLFIGVYDDWLQIDWNFCLEGDAKNSKIQLDFILTRTFDISAGKKGEFYLFSAVHWMPTLKMLNKKILLACSLWLSHCLSPHFAVWIQNALAIWDNLFALVLGEMLTIDVRRIISASRLMDCRDGDFFFLFRKFESFVDSSHFS